VRADIAAGFAEDLKTKISADKILSPFDEFNNTVYLTNLSLWMFLNSIGDFEWK